MKFLSTLRRAKRAVARLFGSNPRRPKVTDRDASQPLIQQFASSYQINGYDHASVVNFLEM